MVQHIQSAGEAFPHTAGEQGPIDREFLAAIAAHELREPVQAISSFLSVVLQERVGPLTAVQRDFLATADHAARRLKRRIDDLQLILAGERGFSLHLEPTDLIKHVNECRQELAEIANGYGVTIETSFFTPAMAWVLADPLRLDQILLNLFENAIQYARPSTVVHVQVQPCADGEWCVTVENETDRAPDVDPNAWFQAFTRGGSTERDGLGLGLTAVDYLVRAQEGRVSARACDNRVFFTVTLPVPTPDWVRHSVVR